MRKAINNGDIIIVSNLEYIGDYDKRGYKPEFTRTLRAWIVDDIGNNGTIHAHDIHGKRKMIHALDKPPCYPYIVRVVPARGI